MIALTPSDAATIQTAINNVTATLNAALTQTSTYSRTQLSQARLALSYYANLSQQVSSLVSTAPRQQYIVQTGDTLHSIAQSQLGDATQFQAIMLASNQKDQNIVPGQILTIPTLVNNGQST